MADKAALHVDDVSMRVGTGYPAPHDVPCRQRGRRRLSDAFGLSQFGADRRARLDVGLVVLAHWMRRALGWK